MTEDRSKETNDCPFPLGDFLGGSGECIGEDGDKIFVTEEMEVYTVLGRMDQ